MSSFQPGDRIRVDRPGVAHQHKREGVVVEACTHMGKPAHTVQLDPTPDPATPCRFPIPDEHLRLIGRAHQNTGNDGGKP